MKTVRILHASSVIIPNGHSVDDGCVWADNLRTNLVAYIREFKSPKSTEINYEGNYITFLKQPKMCSVHSICGTHEDNGGNEKTIYCGY